MQVVHRSDEEIRLGNKVKSLKQDLDRQKAKAAYVAMMAGVSPDDYSEEEGDGTEQDVL